MKKNMTRGLIALGLLVAGGMGIVAIAQVAVSHDADRRALLSIKDAYEQALNNDNIGALASHLDAEFSGTLATGAQVRSRAELDRHWSQLRNLVGLGRGGKYTVKVNPVPLATMFVSDVAVSFGSTDESLVLAREPGKTYEFHSSWVAVSRKRGDAWKLASMHTTMLNPQNTFNADQLATVAKLVSELRN